MKKMKTLINYTIDPIFIPPWLAERAPQEIADIMSGKTHCKGDCWTSCGGETSLLGKIGMILAWYYDGGVDGPEDIAHIQRLIPLVPELLAGHFHKINAGDLYLIYDALGCCGNRDQLVDHAFRVVSSKIGAQDPRYAETD